MFLCTGNAARSVMATVITRSRSDLFELSGAGTHAIENCPMGNYTRKALASIGLEDRTHRSRQLNPYSADEVDLIIAMANDHVQYVRRNMAEVAYKTVTFKRLIQDLGEVKAKENASLREALKSRIAEMSLAEVQLESWEEIGDPGAGDQPIFMSSLEEIDALVDRFLALFATYRLERC